MAIEEHQTQMQDSEEQVVVFTLADESYGINIEVVNTIIRLPEITRVPRSPNAVDGVINLRGAIIPVIDLRKRFALPQREATKATRIVVVENDGLLVGLVVDAVTETLRIPTQNIEALSPLVVSVDSRYLRGVGKIGDRLIILLALANVLAADELTHVKQFIEQRASA